MCASALPAVSDRVDPRLLVLDFAAMLAENVGRDNGAEGVLRVMLICRPSRAIAKEVGPQLKYRGGGIHRSTQRSRLLPDRDNIFSQRGRTYRAD